MNPVCGECGCRLGGGEDSARKSGPIVIVLLLFLVLIIAIGAYGAYRFLQEGGFGADGGGAAKAICPSTELRDFMARFPSSADWVEAAGVCLRQGEVGDTSAYRLRFELGNGQVSAFNAHGDKVTAFPESDAQAWAKVIAKYRMIDALNGVYNPAARPVVIGLEQGNGLHSFNERLDFSFAPNSAWRYFVLFDLAGTGELQFLYPLAEQGDKPALGAVPYTLPLNVMPPAGEDDLVAIFCARPQAKAIALLHEHNGKIAPAAQSLLELLDKDCQIGIYPFFTAAEPGTDAGK